MDEKSFALDKLIHIAKLGASGDGEKVKIQAMRLIRLLKENNSPLAEEIKKAVFSDPQDPSPSNGSIRRVKDNGVSSPPPIDKDSGSEILNIDDPVKLPTGFIGSNEVKGPINFVLEERKKIKAMVEAGIRPTSKLLFTGPPGVGKTVCAKYVAQKLNVPLLTLDLATVVSSLFGKTGNNIKEAISYARSRPCVLLVDEIDAIAKMRDDASDIGETKRLVTVLLQELDRWSENNILIAATNHYHLLDPAIHRRFDKVIEFHRPSSEDLKKVGLAIVPQKGDLPREWVHLLTLVMEGTSFSDFQREINNLRKSYFLFGEGGVQDYLTSLLNSSSFNLDKERRKTMAVQLVKERKISQRAASRITSIARGTLKHALEAS